MDREKLQTLLERQWTFARAFDKNNGDYDATVLQLANERLLANERVSGGEETAWSANTSEMIAICKGLHELKIDPTPLWEYHLIVRYDRVHTAGELEGQPLRDLRHTIRKAFLPVMLLDDGALPPHNKKSKPEPDTLVVIKLIQDNLDNDAINKRTGKSITNITTIRSRYGNDGYDLESSHG